MKLTMRSCWCSRLCLFIIIIKITIAIGNIQFIDSMQQLHNRMREQIRTWWKRTKRHQSALTILSSSIFKLCIKMQRRSAGLEYSFVIAVNCFKLSQDMNKMTRLRGANDRNYTLYRYLKLKSNICKSSVFVVTSWSLTDYIQFNACWCYRRKRTLWNA